MSSRNFDRNVKAEKRKHSRSPTGRSDYKLQEGDIKVDLRRVKKEPDEEGLSHRHYDGHGTRHDGHRRHHTGSPEHHTSSPSHHHTHAGSPTHHHAHRTNSPIPSHRHIHRNSPAHQRSHGNHAPSPQRHRGDRFREQREDRRRNDRRRLERRAERSESDAQWGRQTDNTPPAVKKEKEKPSLALSGKLTEDANTFRGVVINYAEPPEARKPKKHWRFYPFKADVPLPVLHLHRQSAFLLGRDRRVADIPIDHPSCSKQHAALQFRMVTFTRADGRPGRRVRPYVIDLGSANGTYVNGQRIEAQRYVELFEKDVVKFGFSSREYVLLHDSSDTSALQEDDGVD